MMLTVRLWIALAIVLCVVSTVLLRDVLAGLLWIDLLLCTESRRLLSIPPEWHSEEAPLRLRGVLVRVTLLLVLCGLCVGQIYLCNPPSPAHGNTNEDEEDDQETNGGDSNA